MATENLTRDECAERARILDVRHYDIKLDLTDVATSPHFLSITTVEFEAEPGNDTFIDLLAPEIVSAHLNGIEISADHFDTTRLQLHGLAAENTLVVVAKCAYSNTGEGLHKFVDPADGQIYLYSQFEIADARRVFACFDQPSMKATYQFTVDAPAEWKVFSNTYAEITPLNDKSSRHAFAQTKRMSTYITAIVAGPYYGVTDEYVGPHGTYPLGLYCRASLSEFLEADEMFATTKEGFAIFERDFDVAYPFEKYDQIIVPEFNAGAMENAGCVTFYEGVIYRGRATDHEREFRANTILHELAHMWFGNLVTMQWWDDIWLNESFAEWAAYYANSLGTRFPEAWASFMIDRKLWAYREDQMTGTHPIATDMIDLDTVEVNFDGITYAKGASTLRQLVAFVGEKDFLAGLATYFKKYAWGNTELKDLLAELEAASGRDLSSFTESWLKTAGVNLVRPVVSVDAEGKYTRVVVEQEPPAEPQGLAPELRKHRMAIGLYSLQNNQLIRTQRIEVDVEGERTDIPELVGVAQPDLLLLNDDDFTYAKVRLDERSRATLIAHLPELESTLSRSLLWSAAWDMTRDGEMATGDFIDLVVGSIGAEPFIPVVQRVLVQARTAGQIYAKVENREPYLTKLANAFYSLTKSLESGSDVQFAAAKNFVATARTPEQLAIVQGLLEGTQSIPGVAIDADFRWLLISRLAATGTIDESVIAAEEAQDVTAAGKRNAAGARASIPTIAAKQAAWKSIYEDEEISNEVLSAMVAGFMNLDQVELLSEFAEPYFESLPKIWQERSNEIAQTITTGLFPANQVTTEMIEHTNRFLAEVEVPYGCVRQVSMGRDALVRALNAQAADK